MERICWAVQIVFIILVKYLDLFFKKLEEQKVGKKISGSMWIHTTCLSSQSGNFEPSLE